MCWQSITPATRRWGVPLLVAFVALPLGCGGGGGNGGSTNPTRGTLRLRVTWPDQTRAIPTAANSLRIVTSANGTQVDSRVISRTKTTGYTEEVVLSNLPFQSYSAVMTAFQNAGGDGAVLGTGTATTNLTSQSANQNVNLSASINSPIDHLVVTGGKFGNPIGTPIALAVSAVNAENQVIPTLPTQFSWASSDVAAATINSSSGVINGTQVKPVTFTVTDRDSNKNASVTLQMGSPVVITAGIEGTESELPLKVNEPTDSLLTLLTAKTGASAVFNYVGNAAANAYTLVTLQGKKVTLTAPQTFGAITFAGWKQNGAIITNNPSIEVDPTTLAATTVFAAYTARPFDPTNGYMPNYLGEKDTTFSPAKNNQIVRWNVTSTKVAFVTADNFTQDLKNLAVQGFDWWKRASGGTLNYTLLADNDTANADVVVCFTSDPFSANCRPDKFQEGLVPADRNGTMGRTFFMTADDDADAASVVGFGKRVIHVYATDVAAIKAVSAHELGHAYGFNGHSESQDDLMFPVGDEAFVSGRDINTILTIHERSRKVPGRAQSAGKTHAQSIN